MILVNMSFAVAAEPANAENVQNIKEDVPSAILMSQDTPESFAAYISQEETSHAAAALTPSADVLETTYEEEWIDAVATAYCPCEKCCGIWAESRPNGIVYTASGAIAQEGVTIAADWAIYPPGTVLYIEDLGEYTVQDCGGAIKGQKIDIYFESHADALQFGRQNVRFYIVDN